MFSGAAAGAPSRTRSAAASTRRSTAACAATSSSTTSRESTACDALRRAVPAEASAFMCNMVAGKPDAAANTSIPTMPSQRHTHARSQAALAPRTTCAGSAAAATRGASSRHGTSPVIQCTSFVCLDSVSSRLQSDSVVPRSVTLCGERSEHATVFAKASYRAHSREWVCGALRPEAVSTLPRRRHRAHLSSVWPGVCRATHMR